MFCQRCGKETNTHIMSMFNTDDICTECKDKEIEHPHYKKHCLRKLQKLKMEIIILKVLDGSRAYSD